jgi:cell division protein FtsI (penicillin-binding protein 3)
MQDELALVCQKLGLAGKTQALGGEEWVRAASDTAFHARTVALVANPIRAGRVPLVKGLTLRDALFLLENRGLHIRAMGTGRVREQSLPAGTPVKRGDIITLTLVETGPRLTAPKALPEPEHTKVAENKLIVPAEADPVAKPSATSAKAKATPDRSTKPATAKTATEKATETVAAKKAAAKAKPSTDKAASSEAKKTTSPNGAKAPIRRT